jgi:NADPH-dependent glutamate synthase beta subunit-like oxidoreductase/Pyruvate/2-oxoacid:ferredoxin oxidoreductase delta subunit
LSAAFQLGTRGHHATIFEAGPALGGVLRNGIPAFRLPPDALQRDIDRILKLGVQVRCNTRVDKGELARLEKQFDAVIVCVGFGASVGLGAKGEALAGVEQGLAFLDRAKRGTASLKGEVVVVGGGNTAIDCARTALRCGAASVRIVYRRAREEMPAIAEEVHDAEREGVELLTHRQPIEFVGAGTVTAVEFAEVEPGPPDASGRRRPMVTNRKALLPCNKVLLALGQKNELDLLPDGWTVRDGRAWKGEEALPVWFAGDCATGEGTVTHAIGNGRCAALSILGEGVVEANGSKRVAPGQIRFDHFDVVPPRADRQFAPPGLKGNFDEVNLGLANADEALRCFSCGHCTHCDTCLVLCPDGVIVRAADGYRVDGDFCKGCGICVVECPRSAMEMRERHQEVGA